MKKCMQLLGAVAILMVVMVALIPVAQAGDRFTGLLTVVAGGTSATVTSDTFRADGPPCVEVDSVFATTVSGTGTGTVVFAGCESGRYETLATSGALVPGDSFWDRPLVSKTVLYTYPVVQNVVTGDVVVACSNLQTNYAVRAESYLTRQMRVSVSQLAVSTPTVYRWTVLTRTDPPIKK